MGEYVKANYFPSHFYISLKKGASDLETGELKDAVEKERLAMWYQDYSHFIVSGPDAGPRPRFIMS